MARGFESKDVEFQQSEASRPKENRPALTTEGREIQAKRRTLELALASTRAQLSASRNPEHRRMLDEAIHTLDEQLGKLHR
jgi:hypothetical protein